MNKILSYLAAVASLVIGVNVSQAQALPSNNIGVDLTYQLPAGGAGIGVSGKYNLVENISIRPRVIFGSSQTFQKTGSGTGTFTNDGSDELEGSGLEYGAALTYNLRVNSPNNDEQPLTVFFGPEVSFWSASKPLQGTQVSAKSTTINLIGGVEYPVSDSFDVTGKLTIGVSSNGTTTFQGRSADGGLVLPFGFAIGAAYRF